MELKAEKRVKFGKKSGALRQEGLIPAELYGRGINNLHLQVENRDFKKVFGAAGESGVIHLIFDNEKRPVLIHEVVQDRLTGEPIHIDFHQVRMDEKIRTHIPLEFVGEAPAVKEKGGILNKTLQEVEVEALPGDLPHSFEAPLYDLNEVGSSIYIKDLKIPAGVRVLLDPEMVIATITAPAEEEVAAPAIDVSEVKVEAEEKKEERAKKKEIEEAA